MENQPARFDTKTIVVISIIVIIFLIGFISILGGSRSTTTVQPPTVNIASSSAQPALPGILALSTDVPTVTVGKDVAVTLSVDGGNNLIDGTDAVLVYDDKALSFVSIGGESPRFLFPRKRNEKGKLIITALRKLEDNQPIGHEQLATIIFKAKKKGKTTISFEFFRGKTIGSTVIASEKSQNILGQVNNLTLTVN